MSYARLHMPKIQPIFGVFSPYKMRLSSLCQTYWKWYRRYMQHAHLSAPCAACFAASFFCRLSSERSMVTGNGIVCDMCAGTVFCCSFSTHNHFRLFVASFCASLLIQSNRVCVCAISKRTESNRTMALIESVCIVVGFACWKIMLLNSQPCQVFVVRLYLYSIKSIYPSHLFTFVYLLELNLIKRCSNSVRLCPKYNNNLLPCDRYGFFWSLLACEHSLMNIPDDTLPRRCLNTHSQSQRIFSSLPNEEYPKKFSHSCELYAQYTTMWKIQPSNNKYLTKSKDNKIRNERDRKKNGI